MNNRNLAMTAAVGLLYLLLGSSVYFQFQQRTPTSVVDEAKSTLKVDLAEIKKDLEHLDQQFVALKQKDDLQKKIEETNNSVTKLKEAVDGLTKADFARESASRPKPTDIESKLSQFLGNMDSDAKLKLDFEKAIQNVVPQKKFGRLFVKNDFLNRFSRAADFDLIIDTPDRQQLAERIPAKPTLTEVGAFRVGTRISSPFNPGVKFTIEAPEFDLHVRIDENGLLLPLAK